MLSIAKLVARAEDFDLRNVAAGREGYYTGAGEPPDYWLGEGSRLLGLDLRAILAGVSSQFEILTATRVATGEPGRLRPQPSGPRNRLQKRRQCQRGKS